MKQINLKSRWDVFDVPISKLPEDPFVVKGEDGAWFMTNRKYVEDYNRLMDDIEHQLMFGKKPR